MNTIFIRFIGEDFLCSDITYEVLEDFIESVSKTHKPASIKCYLTHIISILNYGSELNYNKKNKKSDTVKDMLVNIATKEACITINIIRNRYVELT